MKKLITLALIIAMILAYGGAALAAPAKQFPDVAASHWAYGYVDRLTGQGAISGMPDGKFYPSNNITRAEFVKIVVATTIGEQPASTAGHWAASYLATAEEKGLLLADEFAADTWDNPIIRQDMAKIMARAMEFVLHEQPIADTGAYTAKITDWATTCESCKPYIAQAYAKGIITGYPDGSFGGTKSATRAEAATMVVRLIDPSYRVLSGSGAISFNPLTDVAADGRMKLAKAEEYMMLTLQSLQFYKEGSKFYVKGDLPELPDGFENWLNITVQFKSGTGLALTGPSTYTFVKENLISNQGSFVYELKGMTSTVQVEVAHIKIAVNALNTTNSGYEKYEGLWAISSLNKDEIALIDNTNHDKQTNKYYDFSQLFTW